MARERELSATEAQVVDLKRQLELVQEASHSQMQNHMSLAEIDAEAWPEEMTGGIQNTIGGVNPMFERNGVRQTLFNEKEQKYAPSSNLEISTSEKQCIRVRLVSTLGLGIAKDYFVTFEIAGTILTSSTVFGSSTPRWDDHETFTINIDSVTHDVMTVTVWEHANVLNDEAIAKGSLNFEPFAHAQPVVDHRLVLDRLHSEATLLQSPRGSSSPQGPVSVILNLQLMDRKKAQFTETHCIVAYEQYMPFTGWSNGNLPPDFPAFKCTSDLHSKTTTGPTFADVVPKLSDDWQCSPWKEVQPWQYGRAYNSTKWFPEESALLLFRCRILKRVSTHLDAFEYN